MNPKNNPDKRNVGKELSWAPQVTEPGFVTEDKEDIIRVREVPMQADFEEGADEIITIKERSPEESAGEPEDSAEEVLKFKEGEGLLDPEQLRKEAEKSSGN